MGFVVHCSHVIKTSQFLFRFWNVFRRFSQQYFCLFSLACICHFLLNANSVHMRVVLHILVFSWFLICSFFLSLRGAAGGRATARGGRVLRRSSPSGAAGLHPLLGVPGHLERTRDPHRLLELRRAGQDHRHQVSIPATLPPHSLPSFMCSLLMPCCAVQLFWF